MSLDPPAGAGAPASPDAAPPDGASFAGRLDGVHPDHLLGWAFDPARPTERVVVRVLHRRRVLGRAVAREERPDVQAALGHPDGRVGFRLPLAPADALALMNDPEGLSILLGHRNAGRPAHPLPLGPAWPWRAVRQHLLRNFLGPAWDARPVEVALACVLQDTDAEAVREFLAWHLAVGAQLIRLYDAGGNDGLEAAVAPWRAARLVEVLPCPGADPARRAQREALAGMHAIATLRDRAAWIGLLGSGEFLLPAAGGPPSLPALLGALPEGADLVTLGPPPLGRAGERSAATHGRALLRPEAAGIVSATGLPVMRDGAVALAAGASGARRVLDPAEAAEAAAPALGLLRRPAEGGMAAAPEATRFLPAMRAMLRLAGRFGAVPAGSGAALPPPPSVRLRLALAGAPDQGRMMVAGAAVDLARPDRPLPVTVHDAFGRPLGRLQADGADAALADAGIGAGRNGFRLGLRTRGPTLALSRLYLAIGAGGAGVWREAWPVAACTDLEEAG